MLENETEDGDDDGESEIDNIAINLFEIDEPFANLASVSTEASAFAS